jgi:hypothetical protein
MAGVHVGVLRGLTPGTSPWGSRAVRRGTGSAATRPAHPAIATLTLCRTVAALADTWAPAFVSARHAGD